MARLARRLPIPPDRPFGKFKCFLREDFNFQCVYCTIHENDFGGQDHFDVEHFRPKSIDRFKPLRNKYTNLLYSCHPCNNNKGADWPSDDPIADNQGYLDPCDHDYDDHIRLTANFTFEGITPVGTYLIQHLHVNRPRAVEARQHRDVLNRRRRAVSTKFNAEIAEAQAKLRDPSLSAATRQEVQELLDLTVDLKNEWERNFRTDVCRPGFS